MSTSSSERKSWQEDICFFRRFFFVFSQQRFGSTSTVLTWGAAFGKNFQHSTRLGCCIWKEFPVASCRARGFDQHGTHLGCCIWKEFPARYSLGVLHLERISSTVLTWGAAFGKNFLWLHAVQEAWQLLLVPAMSIGSHEKVVSAEMTRK